MTVASRLAASWSAFERAGMLTAAQWENPIGATVTANVMFDAPGALVGDGIVSTDYTIAYRVSDFPTLREQDRVMVGAKLYRVREMMPQGDGLIARAMLVEN
jgi:hypothetical protein